MEQLVFPITKKEAQKKGVEYSPQANKDALFPSRLRKLREKKGVSQAVLSATLGISKSTLGLWETGDTLPDAKSLRDLADYFDVSADYLVGKSETHNPEFHHFAEYTKFSNDTIQTLLKLSEYGSNAPFSVRLRKSFELLLLFADDFEKILTAFRGYLDLYATIKRENRQTRDDGMYIKLDEEISERSDGQFRVVPRSTYAQVFELEATTSLMRIFERAALTAGETWGKRFDKENRSGTTNTKSGSKEQ